MTLLVRHAESEWNRQFGAYRIDAGILDPAITEDGRAQADAIPGSLAGLGVARILSSPYRRALQTASVVAKALGLPIEVEPLVRERCAFSCDLGSQPEALQAEFPAIDLGRLQPYWWGGMIESVERLHARCALFRRELARRPDRHELLIVTHWGFIRALTGLEVHNATCVRLDDEALAAATED